MVAWLRLLHLNYHIRLHQADQLILVILFQDSLYTVIVAVSEAAKSYANT